MLCTPICAEAVNITEELVYQQDFDSYFEGFSVESAGLQRIDAARGIHDIVRDDKNPGNYCGRYIKKGDGEMFLRQLFPSTLYGTVTVKMSFRTESSSYQTWAIWGKTASSSEKNIVGFSCNNFNISGISLQKGEWVDLTMKIDTENNLYSAWVDDNLIADCNELSDDIISLSYFRMNVTAKNEAMYFDNIEIYCSWQPLAKTDGESDADAAEIEMPENGELYVSDFGAKPDDDEDDTAAINKAIKTASKIGNNVKVVFEKGRYICGEKTGSYAIIMENVKNVELVGNDCEIYITDPFAGTFRLDGSSGLTIRDLTVKYKQAPWAQGYVESVDLTDGTFIYDIMDGYDIFANPQYKNLQAAWGVAMENDDPTMMRKDVVDHFKFSKIESVSEGKYKVWLSDPSLVKGETLRVGDRIIYTNRSNGVGHVFGAYSSTDLTIKNVLIHESPDCLLVGTGMKGKIVLDGIKSEIDKKDERWIVSNADGFHIQISYAPIIIKNCEIEGLLDDCINIYQLTGTVTEKHADNSYQLVHNSQALPLVGETVIFYNSKTNEELDRAKVVSVTKTNTVNGKFVFDKQMKNIEGGSSTWAVAERRGNGTEITDNVFAKSRRYGFLCKASNAVIKNNTFKDLGGAGISFVSSIAKAGDECTFSENIVIENNIFDNTCYRNAEKRTSGAIQIPNYGQYRPIRNITISGNSFVNMPKYGVYGGGTDGLTISGNSFIGNKDETVLSTEINDIYIAQSKNVEISDNKIQDFRSKLNNAVYVDNKSEEVSISDTNSIETLSNSDYIKYQSSIPTFDFAIAKESPVIDGDLSDWSKNSEFTANEMANAYLFTSYSPEDLSFKGKYAWDDNYFYLAMEVTDDIHNPGKADDGENAWQYDSVQIAFDSERIKGYGLNGHIDLQISDNGILNKSSTVSGISAGELKNAKLVVKRDEENKLTIYEAAIGWDEIMPAGFYPSERKYIGVSVLANDNDGAGRKGYVEYFSGIGSGKYPEKYGTAMLVSDLADAEVSFEFNDTKDHWAKNHIELMSFYGIVKGDENNNFNPENTVTLAEFISMLVRLRGYELISYKNIFSDVSADAWYADYVQTAVENGMLDGAFIENNCLNASVPLTRAMAAALISKTLNLKRTKDVPYDLEDIDYIYKYYMEAAIDKGIFTGYSDGSFKPQNSLKRAEAAVLLAKLGEE